ncbi:uncharacterized protein RCC_08003 [Ramularia collo-cygni]|uniref:Uncharacterized protein n=1 Tax=Ramularia collo-cygni TaxID=112498 RepID=A0A2D3VGT4_9PEZI|nr:uncharacterized protein RCC_08003 [Ramularia collo-cygni]CZT22134.1 uncharacterized protein RCC_08003 [Ramularia collo-cygni]
MAAVSLKRLCEEFLLPEEERYINLPPTDSYPDVELEDPELKRGVQPAGKVDPLQLAIHNINTFKKNQPLTKPQDEALKKMKTWIEKYTAAEMTKLSSSAMSRFVLTFSKVFFLKDMPTKKMVVKFEKLNRKGKILYGDSKHLGKDKHRIRLDPRDHSRAKGVADHKIALLGTLFHECNHA